MTAPNQDLPASWDDDRKFKNPPPHPLAADCVKGFVVLRNRRWCIQREREGKNRFSLNRSVCVEVMVVRIAHNVRNNPLNSHIKPKKKGRRREKKDNEA